MAVRLTSPAVVAAAGVACLAVAVVSVAAPGHHHRPAGTPTQLPPAATTAANATTGGGVTAASIARTQQHLRQVPRDWTAWASLGADYVEQARLTVDPTYYPKAQAALARSFALQPRGNFIACAGSAALAAARHQFRAALRFAEQGLRIDPQNAVLEGVRSDALTQLGRYSAAAAAARRMELLRPGSDAEARLSYAAELRGDRAAARAFMRLALRHAVDGSDVAFARYYLGDLALHEGRPAAALTQYRQALAADPTYVAAREGIAKADAALGRSAAAVQEFARVVALVPQPAYVLEYGELLQSLGRSAAAARQYALFRTEERLFAANGVTLDTDETLFEADHGDVTTALRVGRAALRTRPFLESDDAYAWALHRAGRDRAALRFADRALATGMRNALFRYHHGVIQHALGDDVAARNDLRAALRIDPQFSPLAAPRARQLLAAIGRSA